MRLLILLLLPSWVLAQVDSIDYFTKQSDRYHNSGNDSMLIIVEKMMSRYPGNARAMTRAMQIKGVYWEEAGAYQKALDYYDSAFRFALDLRDSVEIGRIYHLQTVAYIDIGDYAKATQVSTAALRLTKEDEQIWMLTNLQMAVIMNHTGKPADALRYASVVVNHPQVNRYAKSGALIEVGGAKMALGKLDSAALAFEAARQLLGEDSQRDAYYVACNNLGVVYYYQNKFQEAINSFALTLDAARKANDQENEALALINIGDTYTALSDFTRAEKFLNDGIAQAKKIGNKRLARDGFEYLVGMATKKNDWKSAFEFLKMNKAYKDSLLNENTSNRIAQLQTQYETQQKEAEIKTLRQEARFKQIQLVTIALLAILLFGAAWLIYSRRTLKLKKQLAEEREQLQKERFRIVLETEEREKKRIARELHDGLGQMLSTARLLVSDLEEDNPQPKLAKTLTVLDSTISEVRNISHSMMPIQLMQNDFKTVVANMAESISSSNNLRVVTTFNGRWNVEEFVSVALYRTLQEIVNNAIKYAEASRIDIECHDEEEALQLIIKDNGRGFDVNQLKTSKGIGWSNIFSRMELAGGIVDIESEPSSGTSVKLTLPNKAQQSKVA